MISISKRYIIRFIIGFFVIYAIICVLVRFYSAPKSLFQPPKPSAKPLAESFNIPVGKGGKEWINAIYLPNIKARTSILYSHGNAVDLNGLYPYLKEFQKHGYAVLAYDYEGYGFSSGRPSIANTYRDVLAAYHYLINRYSTDPSSIMDYGQSLGTGLAVYLAAKQPVGSVVLQSPFLSAYRVVTHYPILIGSPYNNSKLIRDIHVPLLIIHGKKDDVIPFTQGVTLYKLANQPKQFLNLTNGGHEVVAPVKYRRSDFWRALQALGEH